MCAYAHVRMSVSVHVCSSWKSALGIDSQELSTLISETGSPDDIGPTDQARLAGRGAPGSPTPVSTFPEQGFQLCTFTLGFLIRMLEITSPHIV